MGVSVEIMSQRLPYTTALEIKKNCKYCDGYLHV